MMILLYGTQTREEFPKSFQVQGSTGTRTTSILGTTGRSDRSNLCTIVKTSLLPSIVLDVGSSRMPTRDDCRDIANQLLFFFWHLVADLFLSGCLTCTGDVMHV